MRLALVLELLEQLLLLLAEVDRGLDHDLGIHVAAGVGAQHAHALALEAELLAGLGAGRHLHLGPGAVDGRDLDPAAERRSRHGERHAAMDVGAVALEQAVLLDREEDVEVPRWRRAQSGFALAGEADAGAVLDAGGDRHLQRLVLGGAALAVAGRARLLDHLAEAAAGRAGPLDGEEALGRAHLAVAAAGRAVDRLGALLAAGAVARRARLGAGHADGRLLAGERFLERDLHVVAQVTAARPALAAAPPAHELAEHLVEDVGEARGGEIEAGRAAAAVAVLERGVAEAVVGGALLVVLEDVVGFAQLLEFLLRRRVAVVAVGVILHGELAVCLLESLKIGVLAHPQRRIIILLRHRLFAQAWRHRAEIPRRPLPPECPSVRRTNTAGAGPSPSSPNRCS